MRRASYTWELSSSARVFFGRIELANRRKRFLFGIAMAAALFGSLARRSNAQTSVELPKTENAASKVSEQEEWEVVWDELGGFDDARVSRAIWTLIAAPERTVRLFEERVHPVLDADADKIAGWIADLDSSRYFVRDRAERELRNLGESAAPALREALEKPPSAEVRYRAERILARAVDKKSSPDRVRAARAITILERIGTKDSLRLLERLAEGSVEARETKLARAAASRLKPRLEPAAPKTAAAVNGR